jgi:N-acetylglucosaminyldiphosphoundecaprenol N-acetyl-beta-D-mannosaminyltransferase
MVIEAERAHTCVRPGRHRPSVNSVRVDPVTEDRFLRSIDSFLGCGRSHVVHFVPADPTVRARRDRRYRAVLNEGDLNVPDGMAVVWALRLLGVRSERLAGADAMDLLAARPAGWSHYLYGGTVEAVARLEDRLRSRHPDIEVVGVESPPFAPLPGLDVRDAADRIRAAGADLLWIGLGTPKQDLVAARLRDLEAAPVILCVGAAFDFVSGTKRRAPAWVQRAGLEWAFRLASEPERLWRRYLLGNPAFLWGVGRDLVRRRRAA